MLLRSFGAMWGLRGIDCRAYGFAATAEPELKTQARLDLANFYMARAMYPEAKAVLDLAIGDAAVQSAIARRAYLPRSVAAAMTSRARPAKFRK